SPIDRECLTQVPVCTQCFDAVAGRTGSKLPHSPVATGRQPFDRRARMWLFAGGARAFRGGPLASRDAGVRANLGHMRQRFSLATPLFAVVLLQYSTASGAQEGSAFAFAPDPPVAAAPPHRHTESRLLTERGCCCLPHCYSE